MYTKCLICNRNWKIILEYVYSTLRGFKIWKRVLLSSVEFGLSRTLVRWPEELARYSFFSVGMFTYCNDSISWYSGTRADCLMRSPKYVMEIGLNKGYEAK